MIIRPYFKCVGLLLVLLVAGCAPSGIGRPTVTQLIAVQPNGDPPIFLLAYPLVFSVDDDKERLTVPAGFVTDLASIPRGLWWWQAPHEGTMAPAIVHDFLYWEQPCAREEADAVMYVAMMQTGMSEFSRNRVYNGIRSRFGQAAWENNQVARAKGEPRFFNDTYTAQLINGSLSTKSLSTIQSEAIKANAVVEPPIPLNTIKTVCQKALKKFQAL